MPSAHLRLPQYGEICELTLKGGSMVIGVVVSMTGDAINLVDRQGGKVSVAMDEMAMTRYGPPVEWRWARAGEDPQPARLTVEPSTGCL